MVPAQHDPTYATADESEMRFDYQSIRALPADAGDFVIWNQAILHWGSRTSPAAPKSRVSMALQLQRADVPARSTIRCSSRCRFCRSRRGCG